MLARAPGVGPTVNGKPGSLARLQLAPRVDARLLVVLAAVWACGGDVASSAAPAVSSPGNPPPSPDELSEQDLERDWVQIPNPALSLDSQVLGTPLGWYSLSHRIFGPDAKAISGFESYLYHSEDGVRWRLVDLPQGGPDTEDMQDDLVLMGMTFASGRLVLAGSRAYDVGTVLVSSDGVRFDQVDIEGRSPSLLQSVTHAGDRFFAFSTLQGFASRDGLTWTPLAFGSAFLPNAVAYGGSVYLVAGNGGLRLSADAESWRALEIDCALESACVSDPDGNERNMLRTAAYSDGAFYVNSLKSTDGLSWQRNDGVTPVRHVGAHDLAWTEQGWVAWKAGAPPIILRVRDFPRDERGSVLNPGLLVEPRVVPSAPPPPAAVAFEPEAGSDCLASRCLELGGRLYISR